MGAVQHQHVHPGVDQGAGTVQHVAGDADGGSAQQAAGSVLGGVGVFQDLLNVLDGNEALELVILVHDGQLLDAVLLEDGLGLIQGGALQAGDQVFMGHDLFDAAVHIGLELHVAVGDDADQAAGLIHNGDAGDTELAHESVRIAQGVAGAERKGVGDDAVFRTLDHIHLLSLGVNAHVLMDHADAALPGDGNGHAVLGHGIHGGAHNGDVQLDLPGEIGGKIHIRRKHIALCRNQQYVIKSKALTYKAAGIKFAETHMIKPLSKLYNSAAVGNKASAAGN